PPADSIPAELQGSPALAVLACHCGDPEDAGQSIKPLRDLSPAADLIEPIPYPDLQMMFDEDLPCRMTEPLLAIGGRPSVSTSSGSGMTSPPMSRTGSGPEDSHRPLSLSDPV